MNNIKDLKQKTKMLSGSYLYRTFKIKYLPCTNYRGARIKIEDCNFNNKPIILSFNYEFYSITEQSIYFLLKQGFEVMGIVSGNKEHDTIICCKWTTKTLEK